jgi:hypothetical protein
MQHRANVTPRTSLWTLLALVAGTIAGACSDAPTGSQRQVALALLQAPSSSAHSNEPIPLQPVIQVTDHAGNPIARRGVTVTAQITSGSGTLSGASVTTDSGGIAAFTSLAVAGELGTYAIAFTAQGASPTAATTVSLQSALCESGGVPLDMPLGGFERFVGAQNGRPQCVEFHATQNAGQQYLVMFENMPRFGGFTGALFPVSDGNTSSPNEMSVGVAAGPAATTTFVALSNAMRKARVVSNATSNRHSSGWDFGDGQLYEGTPKPPPAGAARAVRIGSGSSAGSHTMSLRDPVPVVGDTLQVYLAGVTRLNMQDSVQRAVVRRVSNGLVFAEDVRLGTTLTRANGLHNTPLTDAQMDTLASEYAAYARVQADRFFLGRYNDAVEAQSSYVTAVHTLMYDDNIWGYTYPSANYFAFDYWVRTDGRTGGNNQVLQHVADDLFMHEIAHIRHWGMLERSNPVRTTKRGNQWLTEGFARFTERMPIAMRLIGTVDPSRTSNFVLARNPVFNNAYFFDDVPTYLNAGSSVFEGYQSSSYVFDYFADQVALRGGDTQAALRDMLVNAGVEADLDAAIGRWLPGTKFGELLTRARIALYTDDYGVAGLPAWTQYQQYQLRASRPPGSQAANDPRNAWPRIAPGTVFAENRSMPPGTAYGYVIDGTAGTLDSRMLLSGTAAPNVVMSITRIR